MGNKAITAIQQYNILRHEFPESSGSVRCGTMTWFGEFMPSALSDTYRLKITYTTGKPPKVYIVSPKPLPLAEGAKRLPHTYSYSNGKQQLCLFLPKAGEWNSSMFIATMRSPALALITLLEIAGLMTDQYPIHKMTQHNPICPKSVKKPIY